jgi:hypothetical protein
LASGKKKLKPTLRKRLLFIDELVLETEPVVVVISD